MLEFEVNGQRLRIKGNLYVVAESIDYLKARFSFSADWDGVIKTAIFKTADRKSVYHVILDENGICTVPSEVIHAPMFRVSVFGGSRITANEVEVLCDVSGYAEGGAPEEPTPEVYEQILAEINKKVSRVEGMGLSQNSYTNEEKAKLGGVAEGAEVNVQSDWKQTNADADDYIKNKPTKLSEFENDSGYTTSADLDSLAESVAADVKGIADTHNAHKIAEVLDHPDGSVTEAKIANSAVTTDKLADGAVTVEKIADGVLFSGKYDDLEGVPTEFPPSGHSHTVGDITDLAEWAKQPEKPTYTAEEVGALAAGGTAVRATADADGNNIPDTYATKVQVDGLSRDVTEVKGEVGELREDLVDLESYAYKCDRINITVNSADYENGNYQYIFANPITEYKKAYIKLTAKSYGYIVLKVQNGNTDSGITINNTLVNVGDIINVSGIVENGNATRIYIYSPNHVVCDVELKISKGVWNEIIVDAKGNGDYTSIDEAIKNAHDDVNNPVTIRVRSGIYYTRTETPSDIPYKKNNRYISIIGDDKNNCIIRNDNGYYSPYTDDSQGLFFDSTPIRLSGNVTIENLTIISTMNNYNTWLSEHSEVGGNIGAFSYCVHIDFDCAEHTKTLVRNCNLINDHYSCVGAGNRKNHTIQIEECELTSTIADNIGDSADNGSTIFIHSYNLNSGNAYEGQNIVIKNNVIKNTNKHNACYFYASSPDRMYCTLIGNVCKTSDNSQAFISYGDAYGITKEDLCFGNNISSMNN